MEAEAALAEQLENILDEARQTPGLEDRIPEAEAYAETIRAEQGAAFADAGATAELAAAGASARVRILNIETRLQADLSEAMSTDEIDERLVRAESDANSLTRNMSNRLDDVIASYGLGGDGTTTGSSAEQVAMDLRAALDKDIAAIANKAMVWADERKA